MGAAGNLRTHQGSLGVKHIGIDPLQVVPAEIIIAIAGGAHKTGSRNLVLLHGPQHLGLVMLCHLVHGVKAFLQTGNGLFAVCVNGRRDAHGLIHFQ